MAESIMSLDAFRIPTDAEIDLVEQTLGLQFHPDYRAFLTSENNVTNAGFEPAVVLPGSGHLYLVEMAKIAWDERGVPRDLLPFVDNNGDYFCLTETGEVVYWSHNGTTHERWSTLADWHQQIGMECREGD